MKTRNGFVSNSSTSSFIVLGIKLPQNELDTEKAEELGLYYDSPEDDGNYIVGEKIASWGEDGGGVCSKDYHDLVVLSIDLMPKLAQLNLKAPQKLQLFYGIMLS